MKAASLPFNLATALARKVPLTQPTQEIAVRKTLIGLVGLVLLSVPSTAHAQSILPLGVTPITPSAGKSVIDPEQLDERTPGHLVQDLHAAFGAHGARAVHTKGFILLGSFTPAPEANALSRAQLFAGPEPVSPWRAKSVDSLLFAAVATSGSCLTRRPSN